MQRVVRRLAESAVGFPNWSLIRYDSTVRGFVELTEAERERLIRSASPPDTPNRPKNPAIKWLRWWREELLWRLGSRPGLSLDRCTYLSAEVYGEWERIQLLRRWRRWGEVRVVLIVHDLLPQTHPEWAIMGTRHFRRYLGLFREAQVLVTVSDHTLGEVEAWKRQSRQPLNARLVRVYPGFDLPEKAERSHPSRLDGVAGFFACVGTIEPRKNQVRILEALERLAALGARVPFVFAGKEATGFGAFRREFERMRAAGYPLVWLCPATEDELDWIYRHALATVYPSLHEGFGLPVAESLARGTPCVVAAHTATEEVAREYGGCLVIDGEQVGALASALTRVLEEPGLRDTLSASIRRERFRTWSAFAEDVRGLVERGPYPA